MFLLFNIYPNDLFFFLEDVDICNFAGETTTHVFNDRIANVLKSLQRHSMLTIHFFENSYPKLDIDEWHLIVSCY